MQRGILPFMFIFFLLCTIAMAKSDNSLLWRSYTGVNVVNDIAVGKGTVWFATDGGLLKFTKATKSWRRFTIDDGMPALNILAVAVPMRNQSETFFIAFNPFAPQSKNVWIGEISLITHKVVFASIPYASIYKWMNRIKLACGDGKLSLIVLLPTKRVRWIECDSSFHHWKERNLTLKQQFAISARYPAANLNGVKNVIPKGRWDYIVCVDGIAMFDSKDDRLHFIAYPSYLRNYYSSVPFHFQATSTGLYFDRIDSHLTQYGIGVITYRRYLQRYLLDPNNLNILRAGTRELHETEAKRFLPEMQLSIRSKADIGETKNATQVAKDGRYLWFIGNFHPRRFDTITKRWLICHRLSNELPLGQNVLVDFQKQHGELLVPMNGLYQYRYDRKKGAWIQEKRSQFVNRPRWLKVHLPSSPLPNAPVQAMYGMIAAEKQRYRWLIFGEGTITKSPGYPDPYIQAPARVDRTTGKTRFFHELWGYWAYRVIPYEDGDAWILTKKVSMNFSQPEDTIIFRYDSKVDRLYRDDTGVLPKFLSAGESDKIDMVATSWGALLSLTNHGFPSLADQRLLMAWSPKTDQWRTISLPEGCRLLKVFGDNGVLAMLLVNSKDEFAFWFVNPTNFALSKLAMPLRYRYFMPNDLYIGRRYLWFGGIYVLRAPISLLRSVPQYR